MRGYTLSIDPGTGQLRFDDLAGQFVEAASVGLEAVKLTLRTELDESPLRRGEGVNWKALRKGSPNAAATLERIIRDALAPLVSDKLIRNVQVDARVESGTGGSARYAYTVSFEDEDGTARTHTGTA
jgi:membrane carboxypeptidase/penicillin-binding protein PbpC